MAAQDEHRRVIAELREEHEQQLESARLEKKNAVDELDVLHNQERDTLRKAHTFLEQETVGLKAALEQLEVEAQQMSASHQTAIVEKDSTIASLEHSLVEIKEEQVIFADTIQELQAELEGTRLAHENFIQEASKRQSVISELEHHRSILGDTQQELQQTKDAMDTLHEEKNRQDQIIAELRAQLAATSKNSRFVSSVQASSFERAILLIHIGFFRSTLPPAKLPPLSPPPSIPPPPIPGFGAMSADGTVSSNTRSSVDSFEESNSNSDRSTATSILSPMAHIDPSIQSQLMDQSRHLEEQETMIKTLNKQLTHCESDLQAHIDLVATLETSLTDSERNCELPLPLAAALV